MSYPRGKLYGRDAIYTPYSVSYRNYAIHIKNGIVRMYCMV